MLFTPVSRVGVGNFVFHKFILRDFNVFNNKTSQYEDCVKQL